MRDVYADRESGVIPATSEYSVKPVVTVSGFQRTCGEAAEGQGRLLH